MTDGAAHPTAEWIWARVHAQRAALIADLSTVPEPQWSTPSLCSGWTVHDVLAHLVDDARTTRAGFVLRMVANRGDFDRMNARGVSRYRASGSAETLDAFRQASGRRSGALAPRVTRLVEAVVHADDIRRPLGILYPYPVDELLTCLTFQLAVKVGFGGGRERAEGLRLVATDAPWTHGEAGAPEVRGDLLDLLQAMSGRDVLDVLDGEGVAEVRERSRL